MLVRPDVNRGVLGEEMAFYANIQFRVFQRTGQVQFQPVHDKARGLFLSTGVQPSCSADEGVEGVSHWEIDLWRAVYQIVGGCQGDLLLIFNLWLTKNINQQLPRDPVFDHADKILFSMRIPRHNLVAPIN